MGTSRRLEGASLSDDLLARETELLEVSGDVEPAPEAELPAVVPESAVTPFDAIERALREEPGTFEFFQAVRLLERLRPGRTPVGHDDDRADELVRFSVNPTLAFPTSEIASLDLPADGVASMSVNFMGLTGPLGVLPHEYTLFIAERLRARDSAPAAFLDLFHHRMISYFYRAWKKNRLVASYESAQDDRLTRHVLDLVGWLPDGSFDGAALPLEALPFYAGLLAPAPRSAAALEQLLEEFFQVPIEVQQFVGGWFPLPRRDQCELDTEDASSQLGLGAVAGDELWDQQARIRLRVGPLSREQYADFLPTGSAYRELRALARFHAHDQFETELQLVLERDQVPGFVLGAPEEVAQPLGWSTWIRTAPRTQHADDTILRL